MRNNQLQQSSSEKNNHPVSSYGYYLGESEEKRAGAGRARAGGAGGGVTRAHLDYK